jgi:hypothetical protein
VSATAEALLEQFDKLSPIEQQEILRQLLRLRLPRPTPSQKQFPTVRVSGGVITSEQVAELLDDE